MNELAVSDASPYIPPGRPVRRFVSGIALVSALLVAIALIGPLRADLDMDVPYWQIDGDRASAQIEVTNDGRFAVDVTGFDGRGLREPAPVDRVRVEPGETVTVTAVLIPACGEYSGVFGPPLELEAEVMFGLGRTVRGNTVIDSVAQTVCNPI